MPRKALSVLSHGLTTTAALSTCLALGWPPGLLADDYPSRPIRIVVGFAPGGGVDVLARVITQKISEKYNQAAFVENRAGANSNLAAENVARSPADGYSLLMITTSHLLNAVSAAKIQLRSHRLIRSDNRDRQGAERCAREPRSGASIHSGNWS